LPIEPHRQGHDPAQPLLGFGDEGLMVALVVVLVGLVEADFAKVKEETVHIALFLELTGIPFIRSTSPSSS